MAEITEFTTLPEEFDALGIKDLIVGETAYAVPWSVWVRLNGTAAINGSFNFEEHPSGTLSMEIKKVGPKIQVNLKTIGNYKFERSETPPHNGSSEEDYIPVIFIK